MLWHAQNVHVMKGGYEAIVVFGLAAQWVGLIVEAVADQQKFNYKAKAENKTHWCDTGLYTTCRHPNYLGEIVFWLGTFIAGVPAMCARPIVFVPSTLGLAFILNLMKMAARRGDKKQAEKYADNADYKRWAANSYSLWPGN